MLGKLFRWTAFLVTLAAGAIVVLRLIYPLPSLDARNRSSAIPASTDTALGADLLPDIAAHPGTSGILPLPGGVDAFAARVVLARAAEASIDAQYYIWQDDLTGLRLLTELQDAAERGVRVRLLVDDNGTPALDAELAALDALPHAEVRFFNPFTLRDQRLLNYAFDFFRLNRRMHNKSFTVDGIATILGGRNIGNIYFETGSGAIYVDLDVLAVGPAAADTAADFDSYWSSGSSYPALSLIEPEPDGTDRLVARDLAFRDTPQAVAYHAAVTASDLIGGIRQGSLPLEWVPARLFSDDPAKGLGEAERSDLMLQKLMAEIGTPETSFDIISAYFIPGPNGTGTLTEYAANGIRVRTLTNALEATDVVPVHAGYAGYRDELVDGGVEVYELRSDGGESRSVNDLGILDISKAALHAKSVSVDRRRAFIGSFNFDPRSKFLNCEMGLLIDSPEIAGGMSKWLDKSLPELAYSVTRDEGELVWTSSAGGIQARYGEEPHTTMPLRAVVWLIGILPVEWLL